VVVVYQCTRGCQGMKNDFACRAVGLHFRWLLWPALFVADAHWLSPLSFVPFSHLSNQWVNAGMASCICAVDRVITMHKQMAPSRLFQPSISTTCSLIESSTKVAIDLNPMAKPCRILWNRIVCVLTEGATLHHYIQGLVLAYLSRR